MPALRHILSARQIVRRSGLIALFFAAVLRRRVKKQTAHITAAVCCG